ncbi:hypothetical protein IQ241_08065 [Romeria aff. gracilis LEGE 07310]|uniref:Uncharacterized protein n=2 Tax=Vasconcelosia TaxID=3366328 RepID=A0A8J7ACM2_9CYAN|nr:hypothetical protein [Romeria aff. gracilis LEGE 07310]
MAVLALLAFVPAQLKPQASRFNAGYTGAGDTGLCQEVIQSGAELSRDQLSRLLAIPERSSKQAVRRIVLEPYCLLQPISVREGAESEREAYPLAFDPSTWFVVLYEGDEYAGYDFNFRQ